MRVAGGALVVRWIVASGMGRGRGRSGSAVQRRGSGRGGRVGFGVVLICVRAPRDPYDAAHVPCDAGLQRTQGDDEAGLVRESDHHGRVVGFERGCSGGGEQRGCAVRVTVALVEVGPKQRGVG